MQGEEEKNNNIDSNSIEKTDFDHLNGLIESAIFVSEEPITIKQLAALTGEKSSIIQDRIAGLIEYYRHGPRGIRLVETGGGYRFETDPTYAPSLKKYFKSRESGKLSKAAMETLAIIAYKQPITATEISEIRSVDSGGVIHTLLERKLIKIVGRKEVVGKPMMYNTTTQFNVRFGLNSIDDLPDFDEFLHLIGSEADSVKLKIEFEDHFKSTEESGEPIIEVNE